MDQNVIKIYQKMLAEQGGKADAIIFSIHTSDNQVFELSNGNHGALSYMFFKLMFGLGLMFNQQPSEQEKSKEKN